MKKLMLICLLVCYGCGNTVVDSVVRDFRSNVPYRIDGVDRIIWDVRKSDSVIAPYDGTITLFIGDEEYTAQYRYKNGEWSFVRMDKGLPYEIQLKLVIVE